MWRLRFLALLTSVGHPVSGTAGGGGAGCCGSGPATGLLEDEVEEDDTDDCSAISAAGGSSSARSSATSVARERASAPGRVRSTNYATNSSVHWGPRSPSEVAAPVKACSEVVSAAARAAEAAAVMAAALTYFKTTPEPQRPSNWIA